MRTDHHKLICERQRGGSGSSYRDIRHDKNEAMNDEWYLEDVEDLEEDDNLIHTTNKKVSMRKTYKSRWIDKSFNDHINPIRGFVRKNVGRKWDDVFSDFCAVYDQRAVLTKHLFQHLKWSIDRNLVVKDGELFIRSRYHGLEPIQESWAEFYVDPRDGILKRNTQHKEWRQIRREALTKKQAKETENKIVIDKLTELQFINGTWFKLTFAYLEPYQITVEVPNTEPPRSYQTTRYQYIYDASIQPHRSWEKRQVSKRTLSKKELRNYGLRETLHRAA